MINGLLEHSEVCRLLNIPYFDDGVIYSMNGKNYEVKDAGRHCISNTYLFKVIEVK